MKLLLQTQILLRFDAILSEIGYICFLNAARRRITISPLLIHFPHWKRPGVLEMPPPPLTTFKWGLFVVVLAASWHSKGEKLPQEDANEGVGGGGYREGSLNAFELGVVFSAFQTWPSVNLFSQPPKPNCLGILLEKQKWVRVCERGGKFGTRRQWRVARRRWRRGERRCSVVARTKKRPWSFS